MVKQFLGFLFVLLFAFPALTQTATLQGRVTDGEGQPIPNVAIEIEGSNITTITNQDGEYRIFDLPPDKYILRAMLDSYQTQAAEITVGAGQTVTKNMVLMVDLLTAEEIVVTGTTIPEKKIESSTTITTLSARDVKDVAPRSTTEFLKRVPGFTRVESSGGEVNQNINVRGLLGVETVSIAEDGIMVYPTMNVLFMNADNLIRLDENLHEIEVLVGGTSPIFGSSTAGAIINLLNKTGGSELRGTFQGAAGTSGLGRFDFNFNGPLSENWRFNVGGFYRYDRGVRDPGYTGSSGGQIKGNVTRFLSNGFLRLSLKHINDENLFITPLPFQNREDPEFVPGFSKTGSFYTEEATDSEIPLPPGNGSRKLPLDDGIKTQGTWITGQIGLNFGEDWQFENISRVMSVDHSWNALIPTDLQTEASFNEFILHLFTNIFNLVPAGTTSQLLFTNHFDPSGNKLLFDTANGLVSRRQQWNVEKPVSDFSNLATLKKVFGSHNLSFGSYFAHYEQENVWYFTHILTDVRDNPRFLDVLLVQPDGSTLEATKNGFLSFLPFYVNAKGHNTLIAFFTSDEFKLTERLRIDLGIRYEHQDYFQDVENTSEIDLDGDPTTKYDIENFGNQTFRHFEFDLNDVAFSIGVNYQLHPKHFAIYGSFTRGFNFPPLDNLLFEEFDERTELVKPLHTDMYEAGAKYSAGRIADLTAAFFYGRVYDFINYIYEPDPVTGRPIFVRIHVADSTSWGIEFEFLTKPTKRLELHASGIFLDVETPEISYTGLFYSGFKPAVLDFQASYLLYENVRLTFDCHYMGERLSSPDRNDRLSDFSYMNAGASYKFPAAGFTLGASILNLTQSQGLEEANPIGDPFLSHPDQLFFARPILPMRIIVEAKYDF